MKKMLLTLIILLTACLKQVPDHVKQYDNLTYDYSYTNGLSEFEKRSFYNMSQGIYYLPYDVIVSMSRPVPNQFKLYDELFLEDPERLGLIPSPYRDTDPPVGITVSLDPEFVPMYGISCITCHSTTISNSSHQAIIIDGSGSKFAIDRLIQEMVTSMALTMTNTIEFNKFYNRYKERAKLAEYPSSQEDFDLLTDTNTYYQLRSSLKNDNPDVLDQLASFEEQLSLELGGEKVPTTLSYGVYPAKNDLNTRTKMFLYLSKRLLWFATEAQYAKTDERLAPTGLGRGAPWGSSINKFAALYYDKSAEQWPSVPSSAVDTPFIWNYEDAKWVFYTGTTNSMVERNFAQSIALLTDFNSSTFETTASIKKMEHIQQFTRKFQPPKWPENILGPIDQDKATQGKELFKIRCLACHYPKRETYTGPGSIEYNYIDVGTDDQYFKGQTQDFYGKEFIGDILPVLMNQVKVTAAENEGIPNLGSYEIGRTPAIWRQPTKNAIAAKPLWGVWATAPYLHNGSVLNMRELLTKPQNRLMAFHVGSIEYDIDNLGFQNKQTAYSSLFEAQCVNCLGNSNQGHNFSTDLTKEQQDQLLEFIKSYTMETTF
jgi:hypothetical protein